MRNSIIQVFGEPHLIEENLVKLAHFQEKHAFSLLIVMVTLTMAIASFAAQIQTNGNFDGMLQQQGNYRMTKRMVTGDFGVTDSMFIMVKLGDTSSSGNRITDIRHPEAIRLVDYLTKESAKKENIVDSFSISSILLQAYGRLPATLEESKAMLSGLGKETEHAFIDKTKSATQIILSANIGSRPDSVAELGESVQEVIDEAPTPGAVKVILTGMPPMMDRIISLLIGDNLKTIAIALVLVFFILWLQFRSPLIAGSAMAPVVSTLLWLGGVMVLNGLMIDIITAAIGAMMVGMAIDYSIHLTHAYHERRRESDKDALAYAMQSTGAALLASAATTLAGFIAMTFGIGVPSQTQGIVLGIGITVAYLVTMLLLPSLLVLQGRIMYDKAQSFSQIIYGAES